MPGLPKITLAGAKAQGDFMLLFYCENVAAYCSHSGEMRLDAAIARWGGDLRLDQAPARCTRYGSRDHVDLRPRDGPNTLGWDRENSAEGHSDAARMTLVTRARP